MKKSRRRARASQRTDSFVRGFVSAGLLAGVRERRPRALLRVSLQGGLALLAATEAARALDAGRPGAGLLAIAAAGAGLWLTEELMNPSTQAED